MDSLQHARAVAGSNGSGSDVRFTCGSYVRFSLRIEGELPVITNAGFSSNGCGHMCAAADELCEYLTGRALTQLHGLEVRPNAATSRECGEHCYTAVRAALADYRAARIEEFSGEKALICTCFGVTEERIEAIISGSNIRTVDEVSAACNAGLGCGSCRMMIQEVIDGTPFRFPG